MYTQIAGHFLGYLSFMARPDCHYIEAMEATNRSQYLERRPTSILQNVTASLTGLS